MTAEELGSILSGMPSGTMVVFVHNEESGGGQWIDHDASYSIDSVTYHNGIATLKG